MDRCPYRDCLHSERLQSLFDSLPQNVQDWLQRAHVTVWHEQTGSLSYGAILVDDPREYVPDIECCSLLELTTWAEACARWQAGEPPVQPAPVPGSICQANWSFGVGTCRYGPEDDDDWDELDGPDDPAVRWPDESDVADVHAD